MSDDPLEALVQQLIEDGDCTREAYAEGRRVAAFYVGLRTAAYEFGDELSISAAVTLTETWMTGDGWPDLEDPDEP